MFSLVHEAAQRYIDYCNSTSRLANSLYISRSADNSAEEIVANETAVRLLTGQLSAEMRAEVANENAALVARPGVRIALTTFASIRVDAHMPLVVPD